MELDVKIMFEHCANAYELYQLLKNDKDGGKPYRAKFSAILALIDAYGLRNEFNNYVSERKRNS